jgi:hypothetical protein
MERLLLSLSLVALAAACGFAPAPNASTSFPPPPAAGASPAGAVRLTWHREGGLAGFCDVLTATTAGEAQAGACNAEPVTAPLTAEERLQLQQWAVSYGAVVIVIGDAGAADSLFTTLEMNGLGAGQPTEAEQQAMLDWAQAVFTRLAQ